MGPQPQQPGGQTNSHTPEPLAPQAHPTTDSTAPGGRPAHTAPPSSSTGDTPRVSVQPSDGLKAELADKQKQTPQPSSVKPAVANFVPDAFREPAKPATAPTSSAATPVAAVTAPMLTNGSAAVAAPRPSGRWQTFWYALSVLSLGLLFIATSTVTSQGTLEKMLVGLKPNPSDVLYGTPWNIILGYSMLSIFLVCLPLFIVSTIVVDRYRSVHPDMRTVGMKKLSYVFMVLASMLIVFQIATAIFSAMYHTFDTIAAVSIGVNIAFMAGYFAWLFTLVAEDRS